MIAPWTERAGLGSPAFELQIRNTFDCFSSKLTFEPGYGLVFARIAVEAVRLFLPGFVTAANFVVFCMAITVAYQHAPLWGVAVSAPATAFVSSYFSIFVVALVKVVLVDRYEPTVKPLWCSFVWLNEVVNGLYEFDRRYRDGTPDGYAVHLDMLANDGMQDRKMGFP